MYGLIAGTKKVVVVEKWLLVEAGLYYCSIKRHLILDVCSFFHF